MHKCAGFKFLYSKKTTTVKTKQNSLSRVVPFPVVKTSELSLSLCSHCFLPVPSSAAGGTAGCDGGELLTVEPPELRFPFELKKQISCSLRLANKTDNYIAFKVKTTHPKKYCVVPNNGVMPPRSTCNVIVTLQAQEEIPPDMQCKDKFLIQSAVVNPGTTTKDINREMFNKEPGRVVDEYKLRVAYIAPT